MPTGPFSLVGFTTDRVQIAKLGTVPLRGGRPIHGRIMGARVRLEGGHWFLAIQVDGKPPRVYGAPSTDMLGVDVGLKAAVARSDGIITAARAICARA